MTLNNIINDIDDTFGCAPNGLTGCMKDRRHFKKLLLEKQDELARTQEECTSSTEVLNKLQARYSICFFHNKGNDKAANGHVMMFKKVVQNAQKSHMSITLLYE